MLVVYSKSHCPFCDAAAAWLDEHQVAYAKVDVSADPEALAMLRARGHRTVPQLYLGDTLLVEGGLAGLQALGADAVRERLNGAATASRSTVATIP